MLAAYGYADGSGEYYLTIDTDRCTGCGDCVPACPVGVLEVGADENDPLRDEPVAFVALARRKSLASDCSGCKPSGGPPTLPCVAACGPAAITHSW